MWEAYADPERWSAWAPQVRRVEAEGRLREGLEGTVVAAVRVRARLLVVSVDPVAGAWSWVIEVGPIRFGLAHEVTDGRAALTIDGPAPSDRPRLVQASGVRRFGSRHGRSAEVRPDVLGREAFRAYPSAP